MLYQMQWYRDSTDFNEDAVQRNHKVKNDVPPPAERLWWRVEQVIHVDDEHMLVLWCRPEPFKHTHRIG